MKKSKVFLVVQLVLLLLLVVGAFALYFIDRAINQQEIDERALRLQSTHERAKVELIDAVSNFATLVSGFRTYIRQTDRLPTALELQDFIDYQLSNLNYEDSIIVSYIDTTHTFVYCFSRNQMDPAGMVGTSLESIRDDNYIQRIDSILKEDHLYMTDPVNLKEGWVGAPLNFVVKKEGKVLGYMAPIISLKVILDRIYRSEDSEFFAFKFATTRGFDFDRERVYDGSTVYNDKLDPQYYENFNLDPQSFISSSFTILGLNLTLATAHKLSYQKSESLTYLGYAWFMLLLILSGLIVREVFYYRSESQREGSEKQQAYHELNIKNYAIASSMTPIVLSDLEGNITYANNAFLDLWGFKHQDEVLGMSNSELSSSPEKVKEITKCLLENGSWQGEDVARKQNGTKFQIQLSANMVRDANGTPVCLMASLVDVTERKRIEQELKNSEASTQMLFENSAIPIWEEDFSEVKTHFDRLKESGVTDFREHFRSTPGEVRSLASLVKYNRVNEKSLEFYGAKNKEELLKSLDNWFIDESWSVFTEELIALANGKSEFESEIPIVTPSGKRMDLLMKLSVPSKFLKKLDRVLVSFVDITESKRAEINQLAALHEGEIKERKRIAKELHDSLGQHLAVSKMMLNSIELEAASLDPEGSQYFQKAQLVLDQAIAEARNISHALMPAALQHQGLVPAILEICKKLENSSVNTHFSHFDPSDTRFDPKIEIGLFRITQELVTNILKHAQASEIYISLLTSGPNLILTVRDNGIGFEGTIQEMHSNGIGLRNISSRVKTLHGMLTLDSHQQKGTTVRIEIPIK